MYNKYMSQDMDAFSELYRPVEYEHEKMCENKKEEHQGEKLRKFDLKRLIHGLDVDKVGILPIVLLLLLLLDVDDDEKIIIVALAVIFGL